jgi:hypothetical protein
MKPLSIVNTAAMRVPDIAYHSMTRSKVVDNGEEIIYRGQNVRNPSFNPPRMMRAIDLGVAAYSHEQPSNPDSSFFSNAMGYGASLLAGVTTGVGGLFESAEIFKERLEVSIINNRINDLSKKVRRSVSSLKKLGRGRRNIDKIDVKLISTEDRASLEVSVGSNKIKIANWSNLEILNAHLPSLKDRIDMMLDVLFLSLSIDIVKLNNLLEFDEEKFSTLQISVEFPQDIKYGQTKLVLSGPSEEPCSLFWRMQYEYDYPGEFLYSGYNLNYSNKKLQSCDPKQPYTDLYFFRNLSVTSKGWIYTLAGDDSIIGPNIDLNKIRREVKKIEKSDRVLQADLSQGRNVQELLSLIGPSAEIKYINDEWGLCGILPVVNWEVGGARRSFSDLINEVLTPLSNAFSLAAEKGIEILIRTPYEGVIRGGYGAVSGTRSEFVIKTTDEKPDYCAKNIEALLEELEAR